MQKKTHPMQYGGGRPHGAPPYTRAGIARLLCSFTDCGRPAYASWGACADDNIQRPMCAEHDVAVNGIALIMAGDPSEKLKMHRYIARVEEDIGRPLDDAAIEESIRRLGIWAREQ